LRDHKIRRDEGKPRARGAEAKDDQRRGKAVLKLRGEGLGGMG